MTSSQCLELETVGGGDAGTCQVQHGQSLALGALLQTTCHTLLSPQKPKDFDFAQQKLTDKNLGFQMLQKMGWKEGHGLGSCGKGIREPVSVYAAGAWGQGWGWTACLGRSVLWDSGPEFFNLPPDFLTPLMVNMA